MITAITLCERLINIGDKSYGDFHFIGVYKGNYIKKIRLEIADYNVQLKQEYVVKFIPNTVDENILNGKMVSITKLSGFIF